MKIAIVGTAAHSRGLAPYHDKEWEIWTVGGGFVNLPRQDKHFELHNLTELAKSCDINAFIDNLKQVRGELFLQSAHKDLPNAKIFPRDELIALFPRKYFTSTVAWMIALAISSGAKEIGLWGVDMELVEEYGYQRCGCEYLLGWAEGNGITITLPDDCPLLKANNEYAYGSQELVEEVARRYKEAEIIKKRSDERMQVARDNQRYSEGYFDAVKGIMRRCL